MQLVQPGGSLDRLGAAAQLGPQFENLVERPFLRGPTLLQVCQSLPLCVQLFLDGLLATRGIHPKNDFSPNDLELGLQSLDPAAAVLNLGRNRMLTDGDPRA